MHGFRMAAAWSGSLNTGASFRSSFEACCIHADQFAFGVHILTLGSSLALAKPRVNDQAHNEHKEMADPRARTPFLLLSGSTRPLNNTLRQQDVC